MQTREEASINRDTALSDIASRIGPKAQHRVASRGPSSRAREPGRASGHRSSCV